MRGYSLKCLMLGHEDRMRWAPGRMYLECADCGRQTPGWVLTSRRDEARRRAGRHHAASQVLHRVWSRVRVLTAA